MVDVIHVDEKWFYTSKNTKKFYLGMQEHESQRTTRSKQLTTKMMFLAAVACPRWDSINNKHFDGKLGIWPFIIIETAKRNSRNRAAGTPVMKSMDSITADQYCLTLMSHVLPAIKKKGLATCLTQQSRLNKIMPSHTLSHMTKNLYAKHLKWD